MERVRVRVLVLEDDPIAADTLTYVLAKAGYGILGPFAKQDAALRLLDGLTPDIAVLDIELQDHTCFQVADILADQGVPFILADDARACEVPPRHRARPTLLKPYDATALVRLIDRILMKSAGAASITMKH